MLTNALPDTHHSVTKCGRAAPSAQPAPPKRGGIVRGFRTARFRGESSVWALGTSKLHLIAVSANCCHWKSVTSPLNLQVRQVKGRLWCLRETGPPHTSRGEACSKGLERIEMFTIELVPTALSALLSLIHISEPTRPY